MTTVNHISYRFHLDDSAPPLKKVLSVEKSADYIVQHIGERPDMPIEQYMDKEKGHILNTFRVDNDELHDYDVHMNLLKDGWSEEDIVAAVLRGEDIAALAYDNSFLDGVVDLWNDMEALDGEEDTKKS